jgi:hypothetical protein
MHRWMILFPIFTFAAWGQSFSSGSTGADGPLNITAPGVTVFSQMPVGGGTIFNFTSISIASGSTLRLSGEIFSSPLFFLAQNAVTINGTIDLSGANGVTYGSDPTLRAPTTPGAGGYGGGVGSFGSNPAQSGSGPGAGGVCLAPNFTVGGTFTGNQFLVPLIGGSGGAGGAGAGGGAGGGALLIASSVSISIISPGIINAAGGGSTGGGAGDGSGGAIRLVAPVISGNGSLQVQGGSGGACNVTSSNGTSGVIRLEAFQDSFSTGGSNGPIYEASPYNLFLPTAVPSVQVTSIGGVAVSTSPTGSFTVPDVTVNSPSSLAVQIQAQNIPLGTTVTLVFLSENGPDQTIASTGLAGTVASSTATASVTLPTGYSRGFAKATWTQ